MDVIIGLDVSTAVVGWALLPAGCQNLTYPLARGHWDIRKVKGLWSKLDIVRSQLRSLSFTLSGKGDVVVGLYVEEPLKKFRRGGSSANTMSLLARMNAVTSFLAREEFNVEPLYVDATDARRAIGVKLLSRKKSGGVGQKEQTWTFLCSNVFANEVWPLKRSGAPKDTCLDECDAYVITMAGILGLGEP